MCGMNLKFPTYLFPSFSIFLGTPNRSQDLGNVFPSLPFHIRCAFAPPNIASEFLIKFINSLYWAVVAFFGGIYKSKNIEIKLQTYAIRNMLDVIICSLIQVFQYLPKFFWKLFVKITYFYGQNFQQTRRQKWQIASESI